MHCKRAWREERGVAALPRVLGSYLSGNRNNFSVKFIIFTGAIHFCRAGLLP